MKRLLWFVAWLMVGAWSFVCAFAYGAFNLVGGLAARNADAFSSDPRTVEWLFTLFSWVKNLSTGTVTVAWALVSLAILFATWAATRLLGGRETQRPTWTPPPRRDGVIDLGPDQYSVGPASRPMPTGTAGLPRIPRP